MLVAGGSNGFALASAGSRGPQHCGHGRASCKADLRGRGRRRGGRSGRGGRRGRRARRTLGARASRAAGAGGLLSLFHHGAFSEPLEPLALSHPPRPREPWGRMP